MANFSADPVPKSSPAPRPWTPFRYRSGALDLDAKPSGRFIFVEQGEDQANG